MHLSSKYPAVPPRVVCTTMTPFPSISDGRDLLSQILEWNPSLNCANIIESVPGFLDSHQFPTEVGEFRVNTVFPVDIWTKQEGMNWVYCTEVDPCNEKLRRNRIVVITHSKFLMFHPLEKENLAILVFWADLYGISEIKRSKTSDDLFLIEWKSEISESNNCQLFKTTQSKALILLISENLQKLGSIVQGSFSIDIQENEDKYKLYEVLSKIEKSERVLETVIDDEKIYCLIGLYQKAVEYFSAENDPRYEIYLSKLHKLLNDVRVLKHIFKAMKPGTKGRRRIMSNDRKLSGSEENCDKTSSDSL